MPTGSRNQFSIEDSNYADYLIGFRIQNVADRRFHIQIVDWDLINSICGSIDWLSSFTPLSITL